MKKHLIISMVFVLCLCMLCGCGGDSVRPNIAEPGSDADAEVSLPDGVEISTAEDCTYIYELSGFTEEEITEQIENCLGLRLSDAERTDAESITTYSTDEYSVWVYNETGYWSYDVKEGLMRALSSNVENPISDSEAMEKAERFIDEHELWMGDFSYRVVDQYGIKGNGENGIFMKSVFLYPKIGGVEVLGTFRISIDMDLEGNIISLYCMVRPIAGKTPAELMDRQGIQSRLENKDYSASFSQNLISTEISSCDCVLYADGAAHDGKTYLYPVYVLRGEGVTADGENELFDIIMDAQK